MPLHVLWTHSMHCEHRMEFILTPLQQTTQGTCQISGGHPGHNQRTKTWFSSYWHESLYFPCQPVVSVNGSEEQGMLIAMAIIIITCTCRVPFPSESLGPSLVSLPGLSHWQTPRYGVASRCILSHSPSMACGVSGIISLSKLLLFFRFTVGILTHNNKNLL